MVSAVGQRLRGTAAAAAFVCLAAALSSVVDTPNAQAEGNGLATTPAMGWSSWSFVRSHPTAAVIDAQADALVSSGLNNHGFDYVNLDDFWMKCDSNGPVVDANGRWVVDTAKFPGGIKAVADHVHADGLKFGLYVTPGIAANAVTANSPIAGSTAHAKDIADTSVTEKNYNCKHMYGIDYSNAGAQAFVNSWAAQFASWGVDYLKIDGVGASDIPDVQAWSSALRASGRPITIALSNNLAIANASTWQQYANSWRVSGDIECYCASSGSYPLTSWAKAAGRFTLASSWQPFGGPGAWNDLDSLEIGNGTNDGLTSDQRRSVLTLWSMAASPLLLGTDLTSIDPTDKAMLTNVSVLGVDKDGGTAKRLSNSGGRQVFAKKESSGAVVIALFNTNTSGNQTVSVTLTSAGIASGKATVTDLWSQHSGGTVTGTYSATLRPGETRLIRAVGA